MTTFRLSTILLAVIALASFTPRVIEGRLFDPNSPLRNTNDGGGGGGGGVVSSDEASHYFPESEHPSDRSVSVSVSVDSESSKFASSVVKTESSSVVGGSMCDHIHPDELPEECSCSEPGPFALVIECVKTFNSTMFNDTIGMKIDLDPCNDDGAKLSLDVTEKEHQIDYPVAGIRAGESKIIPVPGLSMIVPGVGNVGLDVTVLIAGNPDMLRLKIGLDACAQTSTSHLVCASSMPGVSNIFPWYILEGTYSFGEICKSKHINDGDIGDAEKPTTTILLSE